MNKDIAISILAGYVAMDIACAFALKRARPLLFMHVAKVMKKEKRRIFMCLVIGILIGFGTYQMLIRNGKK